MQRVPKKISDEFEESVIALKEYNAHLNKISIESDNKVKKKEYLKIKEDNHQIPNSDLLLVE